MKTTTPTRDEIPKLRPVSREAAFAGVQHELLSESTSAFSRANEKVEQAMEELERLAQALESCASADRERLVASFNAQRETARVAIWELRVHREAIGLRDHRALDQAWSVPPPRG